NPQLHGSAQRAATPRGPTYTWGAMLPVAVPTHSIRNARGVAVRTALLDRFRRHGWCERTLEVVARADPDSVAAFRFNAASTRARDLAPWPAGPITALGDAVHATPPTAGMGAGAAIRDAASLVEQLGAVAAGTVHLAVAVSDFEAGMRLRGSEVLIMAMKTVRWILATDTRLGAAVTVAGGPVLAAANRLRPRR
ncbi:FAD-dependent oxidoreductase, partial [Nocardia brasiliensis]|uniref:FAD-dependent oxidoreductase n=1 Tax=Nocardia brasiliensis TaxID=37326 RepID=UPI002457F333